MKTNKKTTKKHEATLKLMKVGTYTYVYVYFKHMNYVLRVNTGNKYQKSKYRESELLFNSNEPDYLAKNEATLLLLDKVNDYIKFKLSEYKGTVNQKECIGYITSSKYTRASDGTLIRINSLPSMATVQQKPNKTVMDFIDEFIAYKEKELQGNSNSLGNYWSLRTNLKDFQTLKCEILTFERINTKEFIIDLKQFLNGLKVFKQVQKYMSANSIDTRLKYLKTFYLWLIENEIYQIKKSVYSIEREKFDTPKVSLTKTDLMQIMALKDLKPKHQIIVDMFVCNSLMGFRWSDMIMLTKDNVMTHPTGETYIRQTNQKTETTVQIEVQPTSLNILKKYNYEFPKMSLPTYNNTLLKIFESNNLFPELITIQERKNSTIKDIQVPRRTLIHSHTSRRNFVNICLDNHVPVNQIMMSTGHKTLSVLMGYATRKTEIEAFKGIDLITV